MPQKLFALAGQLSVVAKKSGPICGGDVLDWGHQLMIGKRVGKYKEHVPERSIKLLVGVLCCSAFDVC